MLNESEKAAMLRYAARKRSMCEVALILTIGSVLYFVYTIFGG